MTAWRTPTTAVPPVEVRVTDRARRPAGPLRRSLRPAARAVGRATARARRPRVAALVAILLTSAVLSSWNIGSVGLSPYYAAAARSMAVSSRALAFGALDPAASITLDKLSGFLVPQALSVALFGFHPWALALPQVLEGLVTVLAAFVIGRRWRGTGYGLAIAGVVALTPMIPAMFGRPTEDGMAAMAQALAFAALQRSVRTDRLRWLVVAGLWVAVGFQAKMMEAWLFLPALVVVPVLGSRAPIPTRSARVALAGAICVLASLAWMTAIQLVPAGARPFIDGTTDDDVFSMVFGYNGLDRLIPGLVPGAVPQLNPSAGALHPIVSSTRTGAAAGSVLKLLLPQFTTQIGWLYPCAATGIAFSAAAILRARRAPARPPGDAPHDADRARIERATEIGFAVWLLGTVPVLSLAFVPHATYFGVIAVPIAAFAVHGAVRATAVYRSRERPAVLPLLVGVQAGWAASIVACAPAQLRGLLAALLAGGALSVAALVLARLRPRRRLAVAGAVTGFAVVLAGPTAWSLFTIGSGGGGSASDAFAGPPIGADGSIPLLATGSGTGLIVVHRPFSVPPSAHPRPADAALLRSVDARNRPDAIPFASDSTPLVVRVLVSTDARPLPMGGYSGRAPAPSLDTLEHLVRTHRLRFVLLQRAGGAGGPTASGNPVLDAERSWIERRCAVARSGAWSQSTRQGGMLFDCAATGGTIP